MSGSLKRRLGSLVPETDEKPFRFAMYNVILFTFLAVCLAALVAIYLLFQGVINPMLWAVLVGTLVFPFKKNVSVETKNWLRNLKETNTPLLVGIAMLPVRFLDWTSDVLWAFLSSKAAMYLLIAYPVLICLGHYQRFSSIILFLTKIYWFIDWIVDTFSSTWVIPVWLLYVVTYIVWLRLQSSSDVNSTIARALSIPGWFVTFCLFATFFGPMRVIVFIGLCVVVGLSVTGAIQLSDETTPEEKAAKEVGETIHSTLSNELSVDSAEPVPSDAYISWLLSACAILFFATHVVFLYLLIIPLVYMVIKRLGEKFGLWTMLWEKISNLLATSKENNKHVINAAIPSSIRHLARMLFTGDQVVIEGLEQSMDILSSVIVMLLAIIFAIIFSFFVIFQIHGETMQLVEVGASVVNGTNNGPLAEWVSDMTHQALGDRKVEDLVQDGYLHGRVWLSTQVRGLASTDDSEKADQLERQVKDLVDRLYDVYLAHQRESAKQLDSVEGGNQGASLADIWKHSFGGLNFGQLKDDVISIAKENLEALTTVLQSVVAVIQSNMSLVTSLLGGLVGVVFGFGFELLNIIVSTIVFLTVLYYLLVYSHEQWKPLELVSALTPSTTSASGAKSDPITHAVEDAVRGVFLLSFKKALFYGMWTWLLHTVFDINLRVLPSLVASVLAGIPLTAPYWVCIPGLVDLWLVRDQALLSALFFGCHLAPMFFIDTALIREVRGSHPYLTGLAIVGGMYWMGLSGAIFGPIVLCLCLVVFHVYRVLMAQETTST